ncbi:MAG: class I SAM-dependent methyltransferase [Candidatus Hodarchaeota archaeon]
MSPWKDKNLDSKDTPVPFTARLIAFYRALESKEDNPLIVDPYAEYLAGDMTDYFNKHRHFSKNDYAIVRAFYIENNLLTPWCTTQAESQIVILGAGLDTRAYRFKPLQKNKHTVFEIDFSVINQYKEKILQDEQPLCNLVRLSTDLSKPEWVSHLIQTGFSNTIPTFWVLEGLVYYLEQETVSSLLGKAAEISVEESQIFLDICVPALADLDFGPFTRHFRWGLDKNVVPSYFASIGWNVTCAFADDHDQGRDVGQRGMIYIHGMRDITKFGTQSNNQQNSIHSTGSQLETIEGSKLQIFTIDFIEKIFPEIEEIVEIYNRDPDEGLSAYLNFIKRAKHSLEKIIRGMGDLHSIGLISPRLLRDPLSMELIGRSSQELEAHIVGYLKAIILLVYCGVKGLKGWEFSETPIYRESQKTKNLGKISFIPLLITIIKRDIAEIGED